MVELRFPLCANFVILALEQLRKIVFHTGLIELQISSTDFPFVLYYFLK